MSNVDLVTSGSGNVFADLGVPNPEEHLAKSNVVIRIVDAIRSHGLTDASAAALMGVTELQVAGMARGQFRNLGLEQLQGMLLAVLDQSSSASPR